MDPTARSGWVGNSDLAGALLTRIWRLCLAGCGGLHLRFAHSIRPLAYVPRMCELPAPLLSRLGPDAPVISAAIDATAAAISEQYIRDARAFDPAEGDNAWTFGANMHAHSWARVGERVRTGPLIQLMENGLAHAIKAGPLIIRPYKLGPHDPEDIRMVRLEPTSETKRLLAESNEKVVHGQLAIDLAAGLPAPTDEAAAAAYAANDLVIGHFGNPIQGRRAIYLGAPRPVLKDGSYWEWVIKLEGPGPQPDEIDIPRDLDTPPTRPFSEGAEPEVPLSPREDERRRNDLQAS